jgi:hypothetical protein
MRTAYLSRVTLHNIVSIVDSTWYLSPFRGEVAIYSYGRMADGGIFATILAGKAVNDTLNFIFE